MAPGFLNHVITDNLMQRSSINVRGESVDKDSVYILTQSHYLFLTPGPDSSLPP